MSVPNTMKAFVSILFCALYVLNKMWCGHNLMLRSRYPALADILVLVKRGIIVRVHTVSRKTCRHKKHKKENLNCLWQAIALSVDH